MWTECVEDDLDITYSMMIVKAWLSNNGHTEKSLSSVLTVLNMLRYQYEGDLGYALTPT